MADPAWPRPSQSGKLEIYCQFKADNANRTGLNPEPIKPYANYFAPNRGYQETFDDWDAKAVSYTHLDVYKRQASSSPVRSSRAASSRRKRAKPAIVSSSSAYAPAQAAVASPKSASSTSASGAAPVSLWNSSHLSLIHI